MKLAMERTGLQQTSRGKMFFILTLLHSRRRLNSFTTPKELRKKSFSTLGIQFKNCNLSDAVIIVFIS